MTGGAHTAEDAIKAVMAGAHVIQVVSALLKHGPERLRTLRQEMPSGWKSTNTSRSPRPEEA